MQRRYVPFTEVKKRPALIVDSLHPYGLTLSHWRGAPTPAPLRDDTSAGSALTALRLNYPGLETELVTANHFDIDGFVGIWSLLNPNKALENEVLLREMALIGDFRELDLQRPFADEALKLVCWLNAEEKARFYPPFGADDLEDSEVRLSPPKFDYFLQIFGEVLDNPERGRSLWQAEYDRVKADYALIHGPQTRITRVKELGLLIVETPQPVHYYALFSLTTGFDIVVSMYSENRYELEYKYTTWVDLASRPTLPRVSLSPLVSQLNKMEQNVGRWSAEAVTDTGPILRLNAQSLSKMERYAHPFERPIYASAIEPALFKQTVLDFFRKSYLGIEPKKDWSWNEIKRLGQGAVSKVGSVKIIAKLLTFQDLEVVLPIERSLADCLLNYQVVFG